MNTVFGMRAVRSVLALVALGTATSLFAQAYPSRPIKILVGYPAGGAVDLVARTVGQQLAASMGQPVVIENKPGAGTNIAVRALIDSAPDGYTLMVTGNSLAANPALFNPPPFDPDREIAPVALVGRVPVVIAASAASEMSTVAKMLEAARAKPGAVAYASPGNGSTPHLAVEFFARSAGIQLQHIPYKGGAPAITDVLGGQLPLVAVNAAEVLPHVKAGKLKVLAVMSANRASTLPDTPTIAESGYPGFEASVWYAFIAPKATPAAVIDKLNAEVRKALATAEVRGRLSAVGGEVSPSSPAELGALVRSERTRYEKLVKEANIKPD